MIIIKPNMLFPILISGRISSPHLMSGRFVTTSHARPKGIRSVRKSDIIVATVKKLVCKNNHGTDWNSLKSKVKRFPSWESWEGVLVRLDVWHQLAWWNLRTHTRLLYRLKRLPMACLATQTGTPQDRIDQISVYLGQRKRSTNVLHSATTVMLLPQQ